MHISWQPWLLKDRAVNKTTILLLTMTMLLLIACARDRVPTSAPGGTFQALTRNATTPPSNNDQTQIGHRLAEQIEDDLKSFDIPRDICSLWRSTGKGYDRIEAYNRALRDACGRLFSNPDARMFSGKS